jgi:carbon-monoxide dehydrogenase small subunit
MLITGRDIVTRIAAADEKRIRTELAGNLCRCTGYVGVVNAIQRVMRELPVEARLRLPAAAPAASRDMTPFRAFEARLDTAQPVLSSALTARDPSLGKGWLRIDDEFTVAAPRAVVWDILSEFPRVVRSMPGAELLSSDRRNLTGNVRIVFGPIRASFSGTATLEQDAANFAGIVRGGGNDVRGGSRANGQVTYRLLEEAGGTSTRVEVSLQLQLQGPLAQFARTGLVKDFASRMIAQFSRNLAADLSGGQAPAQGDTAPIKAGTLLWSMLWGWLSGRWSRGRRTPWTKS